jgi:hypothetical protein
MRSFHRHHIADLGDTEQRGDARSDILAERGGGREHMAVASRGLGDLWRQHCGQRMRIFGLADGKHPAHAFELRSFGSNGVDVVSKHQHVDAFGFDGSGSAYGARGRGVEFAVQMFGDDQNLAHVNSPVRLLRAGLSASAPRPVRPHP